MRGDHKDAVQEMLVRSLREGGIFFDVGAHIGYSSLIAARAVGPRGEVFAFEADSENARRIGEHVRRNGLSQIRVLPLAVWSRSGAVVFEQAGRQSSRNTGAVARAEAAAANGERIEVQAVTLDDFAERHRPPTLVKVDVEGGEAEVLRGAERIFSEARPGLLCEVHHATAAEAVEGWLRRKGYALEWLEPGPSFPRHLSAWPG